MHSHSSDYCSQGSRTIICCSSQLLMMNTNPRSSNLKVLVFKNLKTFLLFLLHRRRLNPPPPLLPPPKTPLSLLHFCYHHRKPPLNPFFFTYTPPQTCRPFHRHHRPMPSPTAKPKTITTTPRYPKPIPSPSLDQPPSPSPTSKITTVAITNHHYHTRRHHHNPPRAAFFRKSVTTMENPNKNLNLDLTLAIGSTQDPRPQNPQIRNLFSDGSRTTAGDGLLLMAGRRGQNRQLISVRPILPTTGPYSTDVSSRPQNVRPFQGLPTFVHELTRPRPFTLPRNNSEPSVMTKTCVGESSSRGNARNNLRLGEWVERFPRPIPHQTVEEIEKTIAARYYHFNIRLQKEVDDLSAIVLKQNEKIKHLEMMLELATKDITPVIKQPTHHQ